MSKGKKRLGWFVLPAEKVRNFYWWKHVIRTIELERESLTWGDGKCRIMGESPRFRELERNEVAPQYVVSVGDTVEVSEVV